MKQLILSILCLFVLSVSSFSQPTGNIEVTGVIDGDTLRAVIIGMPEPLNTASIRIIGIDTPELHSKCPNEKALAIQAKAFLQDQFNNAKNITLKNLSWDKYGGRINAEVYFDNHNVSQLMLDTHLAIPYTGNKKIFDWCSFSPFASGLGSK